MRRKAGSEVFRLRIESKFTIKTKVAVKRGANAESL
jgi:hypothetical protein